MIVTIHIGKIHRQVRIKYHEPVFCTACGASNDKRNFYCGNCGKPLGRQ